jgi:hypothetical protein
MKYHRAALTVEEALRIVNSVGHFPVVAARSTFQHHERFFASPMTISVFPMLVAEWPSVIGATV